MHIIYIDMIQGNYSSLIFITRISASAIPSHNKLQEQRQQDNKHFQFKVVISNRQPLFQTQKSSTYFNGIPQVFLGVGHALGVVCSLRLLFFFLISPFFPLYIKDYDPIRSFW